MTWYKTGTVAVTAGSNAVIGTGTSFIANSRVGDAFRGPDGEWYEVTNIASDTALSIAPNYQGATLAAGGYSLAPMQGYVKKSADALCAATQVIASGATDMQAQVAAAAESAVAAALAETQATEQAGIATAAAEASTNNKDAAQLAAQQSQASAQESGDAALRSETARDSIIQSEQAAAASAAAAQDSADRAEEVTEGKAASGDNNDITSLRALTADGFNRIRQGLAAMVGASASTDGVKGLVPAPEAGPTRFLSSLGTWLAVNASASWGGITGTLSAQVDLQAALDTKGSVITKYFESQQTSWVINSDLVFTHSLGQPRVVEFEAVLTAALSGYPVGTRVKVPLYVNGGAYWGCQIIGMTATTLTIRFSNQMGLLQSSTGAVVMTPANSQIIARVMA